MIGGAWPRPQAARTGVRWTDAALDERCDPGKIISWTAGMAGCPSRGQPWSSN